MGRAGAGLVTLALVVGLVGVWESGAVSAQAGARCIPTVGVQADFQPLDALVGADGEARAGLDPAERRLVERAAEQVAPMEVDLSDLALDTSVHVDRCGDPFYVEQHELPDEPEQRGAAPAAAAATSGGTSVLASTSTTVPSGDAFALNSRPGADFTIFLDFAGRTLPAANGWARTHNGGRAITTTGWSLDADPAFSAEERAVIASIWQSTADAYAPFDVNVTTQRPAAGVLERSSASDRVHGITALIGPVPAAQASCGACTGVAYFDTVGRVGEARENVQPALAFVADSGTIIHELGHNLGLQHHGDLTPEGALAAEYHRGDSAWEPLMGSGLGEFRQWSRGDYPDASRPFQDDLDVLGRTLARLPDDHGGSTATATVYGAAGSPTREGRIERAGDIDRFTFTTEGPTAITVEFAEDTGLRAEVSVLDASGRVLHRIDTLTPSGTTAWQQASTRLALAAGTHQVQVKGVGIDAGRDQLDVPYGPRSDYGSLGAYRLTIARDASTTPLSVVGRRSSVTFNAGIEHDFVVGAPSGGIGPWTVTCDAPATLVVCGGERGGTFRPQPVGSHTIGWTMTDGRGATVTGTVRVTVRERPVLQITGVTPTIEVGTPVAWLVTRSGPSVGYGIRSLGLPSGIAYSSASGGYVGSPTRAGLHRVVLQLYAATTWPEEQRGIGESKAFLLTVNPAGGRFTPPAAPTPTGTATATPTATPTPSVPPGGSTAPTSAPTLPPSLTPGTTPSLAPTGAASPEVRAPVFRTRSTLPRARVGKRYRSTIRVNSAKRVSWKVVGKPLPRGLRAVVVKKGARTAIVIKGTPRRSGKVKVRLRATNSAGSATRTFVLRVARR